MSQAITVTTLRDTKNRVKFDVDFPAGNEDREWEIRLALHNALTASTFDSHQAIAVASVEDKSPVLRLNPSAVKLVSNALVESTDPILKAFHAATIAAQNAVADLSADTTSIKTAVEPVVELDPSECPDCYGPVDEDGDVIGEQRDCCWTHPEDCSTCGAVRCDQSC